MHVCILLTLDIKVTPVTNDPLDVACFGINCLRQNQVSKLENNILLPFGMSKIHCVVRVFTI